MHPVTRVFFMIVILSGASVAWLVLGAAVDSRTNGQRGQLEGRVADLWGSAHVQRAPEIVLLREEERERVRQESVDGQTREIRETVTETLEQRQYPSSTSVDVALSLDDRRKGLMWYPLYDVTFDGAWTYTHREDEPGRLRVAFPFPDPRAIYDGFRFEVDGRDLASRLRPEDGRVTTEIDVRPGQTVRLAAAYRSRGMEQWRYVPTDSVASLEDFELRMRTDFADVDYPEYSLSPSSRERADGGWRLGWSFDQVVTGHGIGMVMPTHIQPGELASELSFSAPISLFFFFLVIQALAFARKIDVHPMNYAFLAASFFAFHLLFGYSADHLPLWAAFGLSSAVSMFLVVSYLRLVVSARFALVEAGVSQLVFLIGFSLAHFWEGFTGLTVVVLSIATLFLLMQLTARLNWFELLSLRREPSPSDGAPEHDPWVRAER